ncbi:MAG: cytidylate kinase-like family protein [Planctomycetes bacterium]|nr:cytidylate kinase-like family protein [Planctomycetota bacterium]
MDAAMEKLVERQMRNWELAKQQHYDDLKLEPEKQVHDFVTISRQVGCGGPQIAQVLGERLHWPIYDKEILRAMAEDDATRTRLYEELDEHDMTWMEGILRFLFSGHLVRNDYCHRLTETTLMLARTGPGVYLGRGIDMILPPGRGLRVRLIAPLDQRIVDWAASRKLTHEQAKADLHRVEQERAQFVRHNFHHDAADETRFDLLLNLASFTRLDAVDIILAALRHRGVPIGN